MFTLGSLAILAFYTCTSAAVQIGGYHYEKPSIAFGQHTFGAASGHYFGPLPTIAPLPPVPALPPLPTGRPNGQFQKTSFNPSQPLPINAIRNTYQQPIHNGISRIAQQYQSSQIRTPPSAPAPVPAPAPAPFSYTTRYVSPAAAPAQPLRIPFGKQAIINYPTTAAAEEVSYNANGRQLKQYAVIEIIDNDIEQVSQPFLTTPFFDSNRALIGASGTGAAPAPLTGGGGGGGQISAKTSTSVLEQQRLSSSLPSSSPSSSSRDAVTLGSGGLGFIRLPNGNIYLGSGSLGYISGQQLTESVNEARTRSGAPQPDAIHFGHGPLDIERNNRFVYRFK